MNAPDRKRKTRFKGFRRACWMVGDPAKIEAHHKLDNGLPLTRTWRAGEPLIRCKA